MRRWIAVLMALLLAAPTASFAASDVRPYLKNPATGQSKQQTGQPDGTANSYIVNPSSGVAFTEAAAMVTSLREGGIPQHPGGGAAAKWADSTGVIATNGARRLELFVYAVYDSADALLLDSARVVVFSMLPKAHITSVPDSGVSAWWQSLHLPDEGANTDSLANFDRWIHGDFMSMLPAFGTDRPSSANPIYTGGPGNAYGVLPGEIVFPYTRNWEKNTGPGIPPWTKFDVCIPNNCFSSEFVSFRFRVLGHAKVWPTTATNPLIAQPRYRYQVRVVVKGYYQ